jgi:hypothetical protein
LQLKPCFDRRAWSARNPKFDKTGFIDHATSPNSRGLSMKCQRGFPQQNQSAEEVGAQHSQGVFRAADLGAKMQVSQD